MDLYLLDKNYKQLENKEITVEGWVRSNRDPKEFGFIALSDGTT